MQDLNTPISRRKFLGNLSLSTASLVLGSLSCATSPKVNRKLRILFYTDVHATTQWSASIALDRAAEAINSHKFDLVFNGGDLIHGGFALSQEQAFPHWNVYMDFHNAINRDVFSTFGNHDAVAAAPKDGSEPSDDPRATFRNRLKLDRTYYSFNALGYHIVVLDSVYISGKPRTYRGYIANEQLEWIKQDLERADATTPVIAVTHIPLLSVFHSATKGTTWSVPPGQVIENNVEVLELFKNHNLILVLQGHLHINELIRWRDTTFITGGAVCGAWWRGPRSGTEEGFGIVTLDRDRVSNWEYIDYGWEAQRRRHT